MSYYPDQALLLQCPYTSQISPPHTHPFCLLSVAVETADRARSDAPSQTRSSLAHPSHLFPSNAHGLTLPLSCTTFTTSQMAFHLWLHPCPILEALLRLHSSIRLSQLTPRASTHPFQPANPVFTTVPLSPHPLWTLPSHMLQRTQPPCFLGPADPPLKWPLPALRLPLQNQGTPAQPVPNLLAVTEGAWGRLLHSWLRPIRIRILGGEPQGLCLHSTSRRSPQDPMHWGRGSCGRCKRAALRGARVTSRAEIRV